MLSLYSLPRSTILDFYIRLITTNFSLVFDKIYRYYCISNFIAILFDRFEFSLDDLLPTIVIQETVNCDVDRPTEVPRPDTPDSDVIPQSFTTHIDELNLLGEIDEEKSFVINSARNDCEFRIDKLNL